MEEEPHCATLAFPPSARWARPGAWEGTWQVAQAHGRYLRSRADTHQIAIVVLMGLWIVVDDEHLFQRVARIFDLLQFLDPVGLLQFLVIAARAAR